MIPRLFRSFPAAVCLALFMPGAASAHAVVKESSPAINETIDKTSPLIRLHFNSRIDVGLSSLTLLPAGGGPVKLPIDPTSTVDTLMTHADGLLPGAYRIRWQVLSVDGHITRGDIPFTVAGRAASIPTP